MMEDSPTIRILIADDHSLFREGLRRLLELVPGFVVVGEAADGERAVHQCVALHPDIVLLDVCMPRLSGIEALSRLRDQCPRTAAVLLTAGIQRREVLEAVMLGARGVLVKSADTDVLVKCIRNVARGGYWIEHEAIGDLVATLQGGQPEGEPEQDASAVRLTRRELQIVSAVVAGASNSDISRTFGLCHQTVKNHMTRIFDKLGVSTRLELAIYAIGHRMTELTAEDVADSPR